MRIIISMLMFATSCAEAPAAGNEDAVPTMESDIVRTEKEFLSRWVDSRYKVVCYSYTGKDLECFPIGDEGTVQHSLDFQNQGG